jgi:hypothetical protein
MIDFSLRKPVVGHSVPLTDISVTPQIRDVLDAMTAKPFAVPGNWLSLLTYLTL